MRYLRDRITAPCDRLGSAALLALAAGLGAFALTPELSGTLLTLYLVAAPVVAIGLIVAWRREHDARRRQHRDTWALLHANLRLREHAQALLSESRHDPLTGLDNRRAWHEKIEREGQHAARYGGSPAVIMLDLDHFKTVNDSLGHDAGDAILVEVTRVFRECLRSSDALARLGGDEFGVLLPAAGADDAPRVAEKLRRGLEQSRITPAGAPRPVTVSIGVAGSLTAPPNMQTLIRAADSAMYDAKAAGRNRVVVASGQGPELLRAA